MLFDVLKTGGLELKNRVVMSPMCMYMAGGDGKVTNRHIIHYAARAIGGVGLIIPEVTAVSPVGRISDNDLGLWNDSQIDGFRQLIDAVHQCGSKIGVQLGHAGRKSEAEGEPIAPSAISYSNKYRTPKEASTDEIGQIMDQFATAGKRAIAAGVDVIEIHAAHGYFINEMLSPLTNKRNDQYGGNFQNRNRFLIELLKKIREFWGGPLFVRVSADEYEKEGNHIEETVTTAKLAKKAGADLIDVSSGGLTPKLPATYPGYQVIFSRRIRKEADIMTGAVGLITTDEYAEAILRDGSADLIFLGRELLRNPYWALYAANKYGIRLYPESYQRAF
ncbi:MAG: NADPH dehydrogenase NamA [Epsilonproteobacteria bacterium]|nr:NADPH dehydrogenase NamA [Campylobacterota bacterium]